jgi:uncharacterized protein YukE
MSTDGVLYTQDSAVTAVVNTVSQQVDAMNRAAARVQDITSQLEAHFQALASTAFTTNMNDWSAEYAKVASAYQSFQDEYQHGHEVVSATHDETRRLAGSWRSDNVFSALTS